MRLIRLLKNDLAREVSAQGSGYIAFARPTACHRGHDYSNFSGRKGFQIKRFKEFGSHDNNFINQCLGSRNMHHKYE
jgi:hypothetical protein